MEKLKNLNNIQRLQIFTHNDFENFSVHVPQFTVASGIPNLSMSTSNSPAANSVHLYAHVKCPTVSITQCSMIQKTYLHSGTSWGPAKRNNSFLQLLLASYLNSRTQFLQPVVLL